MKTLHLIIIVISLGVIPLTLQAYGIPPITPQVEYVNSDTIVIGKVISAVPYSSTQMKYQIQVEQYLKNPQSQNIITVIADGTNKTLVEQGMAPDTVYDVGQRAMLYLKNDGGIYSAWYFSHSTDSLCDPAPTKEDLNFTLSRDARFAALPAYSQLRVETEKPYLFRVDDTILMYYDAWNRHFTTKTFDVEFDVKNGTTGELLSNVTKQVELKPCIGHQTVNATFVPKKAGTYEIDAIFDNSLLGTTVQVQHNVSGVKLEGGPISFPLQQYKLGTAPSDVLCRKGLELVIKTEGVTPACVRYTTANILIERGWAKEIISDMTGSETTVLIPVNSSNIGYGLNFTPSVVKTVIGTNNTVKWINMDGVANDIASDTGSFSSGIFQSGYAWTYTFDKAGTYNYHSTVHPWLKGTIIVTAESINDAYNSKMNGTLSGNVVLAGGPRSGPQANYEVDVYATDGVTIVGKTLSDANGNYSIQLPAGNYIIYAPNYPTKQTHFVSVFSGKNTILNILYGAGYK